MSVRKEVYIWSPNYHIGNWSGGGVSPRPDSFSTGYREGQGVPFYRSKIERGISASSVYKSDMCRVLKAEPLHFVHEVWYDPPGGNALIFAYESNGYYFSYGSGPVEVAFPHLNSVSTETDNTAIGRLHKRVRDDTSQANVPVVLGELRETIGMLRSPFRAMRENTLTYLKALNLRASTVKQSVRPRRSDTGKSLSIRRAQALKDGMSGSWLEFQFGIVPLVSDTKDIIRTLDRIVDTFTERQKRFTSTSKEPLTSYGATSTAAGSLYTCDTYSVSEEKRTLASVRYVAIYRNSVDGSIDFLGRLTQGLGFTPENFVPTVWELIPWSFLVDYFVNVGSILECSTTAGRNLVTCVRTVRQASEYTFLEEISGYSEFPRGAGNRYTKAIIGKPSSRRSFLRTTLSRTVPDELPIPSLSFTVPGFGSMKWANMAALLAQSRDISKFRIGS